MTMPQMPRPTASTAATVALEDALHRAQKDRREAQGALNLQREAVTASEDAVRMFDGQARELQAALATLRGDA